MTGRVKEHFWEQIEAGEADMGQEPDDLELLEIDARQAAERYEAALRKHEAEKAG